MAICCLVKSKRTIFVCATLSIYIVLVSVRVFVCVCVKGSGSRVNTAVPPFVWSAPE
jgi:hypothetical protein